MKNKIEKHRKMFIALPEPLQKQIFVRLGFFFIFLVLFILVLCVMLDWMTVIPFIMLTIASLASAYTLYRRVVAGKYVVIHGRCVESVVTLLRKRTKSILVEADEHMVRVMMKQRLKRIPDGIILDVYVASDMHVYDKDGAKLLYSYFAIDVKGGSEKHDKGK